MTFLINLLALIVATSCLAGSPAFIGTACEGAVDSGCADSCSGVYGNNWTDGSESSIPNYNVVITKVTLSGSCAGDTFTIGAGLYDNNLTSAFTAKFVVYDDDGGSGEPGTRLFVSSSAFTVDDTTIKTFTENVSGIGCLSGDIYVGIVVVDNSGGGSYTQYKGTGVTRYYHVSGTAPATWDTNSDTESAAGRPFYVQF